MSNKERKKIHLVFAHDNIFSATAEGVFAEGLWGSPFWQRYLNVFSTVTVAARLLELPQNKWSNGFILSSTPGVSFVAIPSLTNPRTLLTHHWTARKKLEDVLREKDALIARLPSEIGSLAIQVARRLGKPWAVEVVGCIWGVLWHYGTWQGKVYAPYVTWRTRTLIRQATYALYVTREFLQRRYPCRGKTISCSNVELPPVDGQILAQRLAQIAPKKAALKIGQIGHLSVKYKGIDTALQALSLVRDRLPPFEFSLLGGGDPRPWQQKAEKLGLSRQTTFCGQLSPGESVLRWLQDLDLYIQPSFQEGLPRALIEAMSQGCPALGSTAGGIPELLDHTCLHKPGDSARLAALLIQATTDNHWQFVQAQRNFETAKRYRKTGLDHIRNKFWQEFAESIRRQHI